jgi:hypothetical protein
MPSRWLREFSVSVSSTLMPCFSKMPRAMPACSGNALALGKPFTRITSLAAPGPVKANRAASIAAVRIIGRSSS